ncbi:MAG TPA: hypothetical protein VG714_02900 [Acidobacteriaceae bacterium]|nr:hypothetical protein [Acidobacteriaceae bacterium]
MSDLHKALGDITSIRRQLALTTEFRGYGPVTLAATGLLALAAAAAQSRWLPAPAHHPHAYITLWIATAVLSAALIAFETLTRSRRIHSGLASEMIYMAVAQFLPAAAAGLLAALVLALAAPTALWMLPSLWQIIFSLGVFASCRFLPRPILAVGIWYLLTGLICLSASGAAALNPWAMGLPFAIGQMLVAAILYFTAEPTDLTEPTDA